MNGARFACAAVVAAACTAAGAALHAQAARQDRPKRRDPRLASLALEAESVPNEFASDALLRIAGSGLIDDPEWRRDLLETAYMRAYAAQQSYRRMAVGIPPETRQGATAMAAESTLNRVSLQVRATELLARDYPDRARELFEWIELNIEPATCTDPLVPAADDYYTALSAIARTTFDAEHRGDAVQFLQLYLWRARLPTDMPAAARAILRFRPTAGEAAYLETAFRSVLDLGDPDARSLSAASLDVVTRAAELQKAHKELGVPGWYVMESVRAYLVAQLAGPRCGDSVTEALAPAAFNDAMRVLDPYADVEPIDGKTIRPSKILGATRVDPYWTTADARRLHEALLDLRGRDKDPVPLKTRQTDDWRHRAERFIVDVDHWTARSEATERDGFYQKAVLFASILDLMPKSDTRAAGLRTYVDFLRHADIERAGRSLWFAFVSRLAGTRSDIRKEALDALERSGQPVLALYARIEQLTGARAAR